MPPPRSLDLTIHELAAGGEGVAIVAEADRRAVFVRGAAVGDRLRVLVDFDHKPARARLLEVLEPGAGRRPPPCPDAARCGACDWMHLSPESQREALRAIVVRSLPEPLRSMPIPMHESSRALAYRSRARLHVSVRRGRPTVGMFAPGTHEPIPTLHCLILHPALESLRQALPELFVGATGRGEVHLALGGPSDDEEARVPVLDLRWRGDLRGTFFGELERRVNAGSIGGARVRLEGANRPTTIGDPTPWLRAADGRRLRLAVGGFAQASEGMNASLVREVAARALACLSGDAGARVVELYAGAGNLSVALSQIPSVELVAVESDAESCDAARANLHERGHVVRVVQGDAATFPIPKNTSLLVLDPPRTGAKEVVRALAAANRHHLPRSILYVSCDPPTLGRDLALLLDRYAVSGIEAFEMFPQTSHVETLVELSRR